NLFMLALLEVGGVALLLAVLMLGPSLAFGTYALQWTQWGVASAFFLGLLWLAGFGAKLGLLPFYEWYPGAYGSGSGSSGALMSGVVMNAAYFALGRALLQWMGHPPWLAAFGVVVLAAGTFTAILAILYAFQQSDWRRLLAFSSAENAGVAVTALGAALIFRAGGQDALSALAWTVGMLHLMGHSLAKGTLFLSADAAAALQGNHHLRQSAILRHAPLTLGLGAVFGAMSLAAMPPTAGFVSEWYLFQSLFHDFTLKTDGSRIALALAGAGMALTAAIALATMVKLFGIGLLGQNEEHAAQHRKHQTTLTSLQRVAVLITGLAVPAFAVSLVFWLPQMAASAWPAAQAPQQMTHDWLLVPLSAGFAFISPAMLVIVVPLLALIPLPLVWGRRRYAVRRAPLWCGGEDYAAHAGATTALSFSNALRVFYNFIYRPQNAVARQFEGKAYFLKELQFDYSQAPLFGPLLFNPAVQAVQWLARKLRFLQNGLMNAYLAYIGVLLLVVFGLVLVWTPG
ncbi:MAG TPA: proton-conducting transporter membrane subunit, partial [Thiomonas arsenitoxydans]|nr:proton-conducting transporter membrane subunit [Thiomonas arsenitoxydans]